jgi:hypothetical protein
MRGITHKILARTEGRRRTSTVTRTAAFGSTVVAVVLGMGLPGQTVAPTAAPSSSAASGTTGHSAAATGRSTLRAPTTTPTSTTKRAHVRSGGS